MKNIIKFKNQGSTLIEVLLYLAIVSMFVVMVTNFSWDAIESKSKNDSMAEVNDNTRLVIEQITKNISNAKSIVAPNIKGQSSSQLVLNMPDNSQTVFTVSDNHLFISEKGQAQVAITSSEIQIDKLIFTNLSRDGTKGNVQIDLKFSYNNPGNMQQYQTSSEINTCVSLRPN